MLIRWLMLPVRGPLLLFWRYAMGWRVEQPLPDIDKMIIIAVPHTSNWDYLHTLAFAAHEGRRPNVTVKDDLLRPPGGWFIRALGGIGIDRSRSANRVEQFTDWLNARERGVLVFTPEATRSYRDHWKTGFYHTAQAAGVPVVCCYIDYARKVVGAAQTLVPSGDIDADFAVLREIYSRYGHGKFPDQVNAVQRFSDK